MTRKEQINTIKTIIQECEDFQWWRKEALFEAIKALEQPKTGLFRDCISRDYLLSIANKDGAYGYVSAHDIINAPCAYMQEPNSEGCEENKEDTSEAETEKAVTDWKTIWRLQKEIENLHVEEQKKDDIADLLKVIADKLQIIADRM